MTYAFIWSCFSFRCCCYLFVVSAMSFVSVVSHKSWLAWLNTNAVEYRTRFFFFPSVFPFCFIDFFLICQEVYSLTASLRFNKLNAFFSSTSSLLPPVDSRLKWWKWQVLTIDLHAEQSQSWTGFSCVYFFFSLWPIKSNRRKVKDIHMQQQTQAEQHFSTTFVPHVTWVYQMLIEFTIRI